MCIMCSHGNTSQLAFHLGIFVSDKKVRSSIVRGQGSGSDLQGDVEVGRFRVRGQGSGSDLQGDVEVGRCRVRGQGSGSDLQGDVWGGVGGEVRGQGLTSMVMLCVEVGVHWSISSLQQPAQRVSTTQDGM